MDAMDMNTRRGQEQVKQEVEINHSVHVGMQKSALWHLLHYLPQPRLLHLLFRQDKHHARVQILSDLPRELVLEVISPYRLLLLSADTINDSTSFFSKWGQGLTEHIV